jgi:hypothetical protein
LVEAHALDVSPFLVPLDSVKLVVGVAAVQVDAPLVKIWQDEELAGLQLSLIAQDIRETVIQAGLHRRGRLHDLIVGQRKDFMVSVEQLTLVDRLAVLGIHLDQIVTYLEQAICKIDVSLGEVVEVGLEAADELAVLDLRRVDKLL